jgi:MFS superfamily sulfate permease-like transporter
LIAIVAIAIQQHGLNGFLLSLVIAGLLQIIMGVAKLGTISNYFPNAVIEGMLAGIGVIIIKKQFPYAVGHDTEHEGDFFNLESNIAHDQWQEILQSINMTHAGIIFVAIISFLILIAFNKFSMLKKMKIIPGALVVVVVGIVINELFLRSQSKYAISQEHLVNLPSIHSLDEFKSLFQFPDFSVIQKSGIWITAITLAIVASIETLLCIEAGDKMDPLKRYTNPNRELIAQGIGNFTSGLIGGLPMTSVIVRTTANINAGSKTKLATIFHGVLLLFSILAIPIILNKIPLSALAAILIMTGIKLINPKALINSFKAGLDQTLPFIVTLVAVVATDLLKGVAAGVIVSIIFILVKNLRTAYYLNSQKHEEGETITMKLAQEVSFLNKAAIKETLRQIPQNSKVIVDATDCQYIDHDVIMLLKDFMEHHVEDKKIDVELINFKDHYNLSDTCNVTKT